MIALEFSRGSGAERHFKRCVNEGNFKQIEMTKEVLKHNFGSDIFDRLIKETNVRVKDHDLHIKDIGEFKKEIWQYEECSGFNEESSLCGLQEALDRFINVELKQYVKEDDETSSTRSPRSRPSSLSAAST